MAVSERDEFHIRVLDELAGIREDNSALRSEHAVIKVIAENTLAQATKTNGRVSSLETRANGHDILHAIDVNAQKKSDWWKEKLLTAIIGIVCAAIGFTTLLVLQRTDVVDITSVSAEVYDSLPE